MPATPDRSRAADPNADDAAGWRLLGALGITQVVSWGSVYYVFALLLEPLQRDLAADRSAVAGAFSAALLASGLCATWVGRRIDRAGGRAVMTLGSAGAALLLAALSQVHSLAALYAVWIGLGVAMAATLYEPAFAVAAQVFRAHYRRALTVLTLFGGFASTVFWPLTTWLIGHFGWRDAMLWLAAINLLVCVPLHAWAVPARAGRKDRGAPGREVRQAASGGGEATREDRGMASDPRFRALTLAFLAHYTVVSAIAAHLIALLLARGMSPAAAAGIGALIGPMQVAGRIVEFGASRWLSVGQVGRIAAVALPLSLLVLLVAQDRVFALAAFAALYGAANGAMTVVRGALPAELYGRARYGAIAGALATPGLLARAIGPFLAAALWSAFGGYDGVTWVLLGVALGGAAAFAYATRTGAAHGGDRTG